jgi:hypothetical protein
MGGDGTPPSEQVTLVFDLGVFDDFGLAEVFLLLDLSKLLAQCTELFAQESAEGPKSHQDQYVKARIDIPQGHDPRRLRAQYVGNHSRNGDAQGGCADPARGNEARLAF